MGLKEVVEKRKATPVAAVPVKGIGTVRIRRLNGPDLIAIPADRWQAGRVQRAILCDDTDEPFFKTIDEAEADGPLLAALSNAEHAFNDVDVEDGEKN